MDSYELNKIAGAVLGTVLLTLGVHTLATELFHSETPETPGFDVQVADSGDDHGGGAAAAEDKPIPVAQLLAEGDPAKGEKVAKKCQACHTFEQGGANKVGPNLWNIVNRPKASHEGFNYSDAIKAVADQSWTFENLNHFLEDPKGYMPGTIMGFAGVKKPGDRGDLLMYLRTLSDSPAELPQVAAEEPAAPAAEPAAPAAPADAAPAEPAEPAAPAAPAEPAEPAAPADTAPTAPADAAPAEPAAEPAMPAAPAESAPAPEGGTTQN
ncbi:MAG: cytochrome c family protein [Rhodobiaceae bacterium]|nr:cytochrome c family protein [Rhodobiaceae bacterium]MCC0049957.1 cytochrome c family protein [Rhodobiaceae bacterium]